ncbi:alpha/beta hydrolase [Allostreptomyces psammosilenae]|uniref:Pimeloyl-ACP methyl ester carboxylesterase n=1 Tax=Allostreptomyces psammosilenae TaxID=1892865 RepID=A0A852ZT92_9ACTN|nr:alpha/beta hydrolase [Allostreptomyces psammosilenae]NYI05636.1 pimeloyl-ACP methyl ester carboxylesterase [Allostreptomyces psammosilenae]
MTRRTSPLHRAAALCVATAATGLLLTGCSSQSEPAASDRDASPVASPDASPGSDASSPSPAAPPPAELREFYEQQVDWKPCDEADQGGETFECATVRVPLDYDEPAADSIELALLRSRATGDRLGSLLVNPGGPGASAIEYARYAATGYPEEITSRYDIVGVDPRGVGQSTPVTCLSDAEMDEWAAVDLTPDDDTETRALQESNSEFAAACEANSGELLPHVGTADAARDMDVVRALLGEERLTYVGASYGTFLGATYAELFPQRVGRFVLDGAVDPALTSLEASLGQTAGFETAFDAFAEDCAARGEECPLGTSPEEIETTLDDFLAGVDASPLPTGEERDLTESLATVGVIAAMYNEADWEILRAALTQAIDDGDGSILLRLADLYYGRDSGGEYDNSMAANSAVNCVDQPSAAEAPEDVRQTLPRFEEESVVFGPSLAWMTLTCADWPAEPVGSSGALTAEGAAPILVVGTTRDPATPYAWAEALADQLSSGRLLTYDGDGHTAYARGDACVDDAIDAYLLDGTLPPEGTVC